MLLDIFSVSNSRHNLAYPSRQMTIFYAGQAHVFDDVHPNKVSSLLSTYSWLEFYRLQTLDSISGKYFGSDFFPLLLLKSLLFLQLQYCVTHLASAQILWLIAA